MSVVMKMVTQSSPLRLFEEEVVHQEQRSTYIPFGMPNYSEEEIQAVASVLRSGWVGMGNQTIKFEEELANVCKAPYVSTVNSCTSALFLSLLLNNVQQGDEVIVPSLTWCSTANSALYLGATPVFADIEPDTFCVSVESILKRITPKTKAIIVVHYGGYAVDVEELRRRVPRHIAIIEDAAHAMGSFYENGMPVGSSGNLTCFSFYANKNLSTGDGGAIALFDEEKNNQLKSLRQHSMNANAWNRFVNPKSILYSMIDTLGYKMNYTDLHASIGRVQLRRQPEFNQIRNQISDYYYEHLKNLQPEITFQKNVTSRRHTKHIFAIVLPTEHLTITRDEFVLKMRDRNIGVSIHYYPLHKMPLYQYSGEPLTVTEQVAGSIISLPMSASMTMADAEYIVDCFKEIFAEHYINQY